jgi:hypothetical protein
VRKDGRARPGLADDLIYGLHQVETIYDGDRLTLPQIVCSTGLGGKDLPFLSLGRMRSCFRNDLFVSYAFNTVEIINQIWL